MNTATLSGLLARLHYRTMLGSRYLGAKRRSDSFAFECCDAIQLIYVINLDRKPDRWRRMSRELGRLHDRSGRPLSALSRRFSAVDARYHHGLSSSELIQPHYSLADQLFVQPNPLLDGFIDAQAQHIEMTPQEVAVALSHVEVWKLIAASNRHYTLVLEDDVYFRRGFARMLDDAWAELMQWPGKTTGPDMVYLSYMEADEGGQRRPFSDLMFRPVAGLWQLSGYVLSRSGARKLLGLLPVRGPVDLWLNHQFKELDVYATRRSIIEQRLDVPSTNSYSVLPILSKVGVLTREKPLLFENRVMPGPVIAFGKSGSGLTSLATALSMLGYRCCSDITELPESEHADLFGNRRSRVFDAYVNVGSLKPHAIIELVKLYGKARVIMTTEGDGEQPESVARPRNREPKPEPGLADEDFISRFSEAVPGRFLVLPDQHPDKWELLCGLLGHDYPAHTYPECADLDQRPLSIGDTTRVDGRWPRIRRLKVDTSPWIIHQKNWQGLAIQSGEADQCGSSSSDFCCEFRGLDEEHWMLRDDTFPSNLALFRPSNFTMSTENDALLTLREERSSVREFTSASIASRRPYLYGRFVAEVRPANAPGLITGIFLHRNAPRQEIDMEFLGMDTTRLLVNVYYNPGPQGTKLEYGYRGTPALIDLGFDASSAFHRYEIEWCSHFIRWRVDGRPVHERVVWDPTPIPHLPMQFNVNLWHSRSRELAGNLAGSDLPAQSAVRSIRIQSPFGSFAAARWI